MKFIFPGETKWYYDFYDKEGQFLQSFPVAADFGIFIIVDSKGLVYSVTGPDEIPGVRKYEISFVEKE
jgi:hypothetical protein